MTILSNLTIELDIQMDICFSLPIEFSLEVLEIENQLPSLLAMIKYSNTNICGQDRFWFTEKTWKHFLLQLREIIVNQSSVDARLFDMENDFCLSIYRKDKLIFFHIKHRHCQYEFRSLHLFRATIDADILAHIGKAFLSYPIWNEV